MDENPYESPPLLEASDRPSNPLAGPVAARPWRSLFGGLLIGLSVLWSAGAVYWFLMLIGIVTPLENVTTLQLITGIIVYLLFAAAAFRLGRRLRK